MISSFSAARAGIRSTSVLSPAAAGRFATQAFFATKPRMSVRPGDEATHFAARRATLGVRDVALTTYEWGSGDRTVLLLHGWRGRASQFAPLVRELVAEGMHVVSFDAPGHGDSPGRRTDIRDWIEATEQLQRRHGRFRAIVGHSFGALAALSAARGGVTTASVAAISGAAGPEAFLGQFAGALGLDDRTRQAFGRSFRARVGEHAASVFARYDAIADPLSAEIGLLVVHDRGDRQMPPDDSLRLHDAHSPRSRLLLTDGLGHNRVLAADPVLDSVVALAVGGLPAVDALLGDDREAQRTLA